MNEFHAMSTALRGCTLCSELWLNESAQAGWAGKQAKNSQPRLLHPSCPRPHETPPTTTILTPGDLKPPYGPVLAAEAAYDAGLGLWTSDVAVIPPTGTLHYPALVGGGVASSRDHALLLGWTEAIERRCLMRRPRAAVRLRNGDPKWGGTQPAPSTGLLWAVEARSLRDGSPAWLPYEQVMLGSQLRGTMARGNTDSTGVAAHPDRNHARLNGVKECAERAGLVEWWTGDQSCRCRPHAARATKWLATSHISPANSFCEVWHHRIGTVVTAGCLLLTPQGDELLVTFGAGAASTETAATWSAFREALHLTLARELLQTSDKKGEFGNPQIGQALPQGYLNRFRRTFPLSATCPEDSALQQSSGPDTWQTYASGMPSSVLEVDCGDQLTDALGLHVLRIVCRDAPRLTRATRASTGLQPTFTGG